MTRDEVRLHILELAMSLGHPDGGTVLLTADEFAGFVFDREPRLYRSAGPAIGLTPGKPAKMKMAKLVA